MRHFALICLLVLAPVGAALAAKPSRVLEGSEPTALATFDGNDHAAGLRLARRGPGEGFLASWFDGRSFPAQLTLRPLKPNGSADADAVPFQPLGGAESVWIGSYSIAYDRQRKTFLIVYGPTEDRANEGADAFAQRLDAGGHPIGDPVAVTHVADRGLVVSVHALRYVDATGRFLLVWSGRSNRFPPPPDPDTPVYTRMLDSAGNPTGRVTAVRQTGGCLLSDRVIDKQFLLACAQQDVVTAQRLSTAGVPRGAAIPVANVAAGYELHGVALATGVASKRWAIAFTDRRYAYVRTIDTAGRRHGAHRYGGQPVYTPGNEGAATYPDTSPPTLTYSQRSRAFAFTWAATSEDRTYDSSYTTVHALLLDGSGDHPLGPAKEVGQLPGRGYFELVASSDDSRKGFMLLRSDSSADPYGHVTSAVYSQRLLPRPAR